jgi:mono/diheme cytochrome c family protein
LKKVSIFLVAFSWLALTAFAWAEEGGAALFKTKCGACHMRGGAAAPVNPGEKAASVWRKYFIRGRHPVALEISEGNMDAITGYLEDHAADSDQPQMLAIPK